MPLVRNHEKTDNRVSADSVRPDTYDRKQQFNRILLTAVVFEIKSFKSSVHPSDDAGVGGLHSLWFINLTPFCMKRTSIGGKGEGTLLVVTGNGGKGKGPLLVETSIAPVEVFTCQMLLKIDQFERENRKMKNTS
ncbi:hypothetical protein QTP88_015032 [Uroleucon formosanum]